MIKRCNFNYIVPCQYLIMRKYFVFLIILFSSTITYSQVLGKLQPANHVADSIKAIVAAYPSNFYSIQGEKISAADMVDVYLAIYKVPGALEANITRYHSIEDTTASYESLVFRGEDYKEALKNYKQLVVQAKKADISWKGVRLKFEGEYTKPDDNVRFTVTSLKLSGSEPVFENFYAEIELNQVYMEWEVKVSFSSRKDDNKKRNY